MKNNSNKLKLSELKSEEITNLSLIGGTEKPGRRTEICFSINWSGWFDGSNKKGERMNEFD